MAATEQGGLLTCQIKQDTEEFLSLSDEVIQDISADSTGIYTAGRDGQVLYLNRRGKLNNAFVTGEALQSISAEASDKVYVTATEEGLFRFDKSTMNQSIIRITEDEDETSDPVKLSQPEHIQYCEVNGERYIALLTENKTRLMLLQLTKKDNRAFCYGEGHLTFRELSFEDICFAGDHLIYKVKNRGIYSRPVDSFIANLDTPSLLEPDACLYPTKEESHMAWAGRIKRLVVFEPADERKHQILSLSLDGEKSMQELNWYWPHKELLSNRKDYSSHLIETFSVDVTGNGKLLALAGTIAAVFSLDDASYNLIREPLASTLRCSGANFKSCDGLSSASKEHLKARGAVLS